MQSPQPQPAPHRYIFETDPHTLRIRGNIGLTGFGKSALMGYQLRQVIKQLEGKPVSRILQVSSRVDSYNFPFGRIVASPSEIARIIDQTPHQFNLRLITKNIFYFSFVCQLALELGNCWLFLDEVSRYSTPTKAGTKMEPESFDEVICEGRHDGTISVVYACQRPSQIHNNLLNESQEKNIFCTDDLKSLGPTLRSRDNRDLAQSLPKMHFFRCIRGKEPQLCVVPKNERL